MLAPLPPATGVIDPEMDSAVVVNDSGAFGAAGDVAPIPRRVRGTDPEEIRRVRQQATKRDRMRGHERRIGCALRERA